MATENTEQDTNACEAPQGCACGVPAAEQTKAKKKRFWSDWSGKRKFWSIVGIALLISFIISGATHGDKVVYVPAPSSSGNQSQSSYAQQGAAAIPGTQNGTSQDASGLSKIYADVQKKIGDVSTQQDRVNTCQAQYPPTNAKYGGDQCLTQLLTQAHGELTKKVNEYNTLSGTIGPAGRGSMPAALDPTTGAIAQQ